MPEQIDPGLCATLSTVLRMIPDVKLVLARDAFADFVWMASQHLAGATVVPWADQHHFPNLTQDDLTALTCGPHRITPKGARLVKRLVERDLIPRQRSAGPPDLSALDAYIASEPDLIQRTIERQARRQQDLENKTRAKAAARAAFTARIAHLAVRPEDARPDEVTRKVIDAIFLRRFGRGFGGRITLAGMECFKGVLEDGSPAEGASRAWRHLDTIYWVDADGVRHGDRTVRVRGSLSP